MVVTLKFYNKRTTPHKLRHLLVLKFIETGSIVTTAQLLGQNNTNSTSIYTHWCQRTSQYHESFIRLTKKPAIIDKL